MKTKKQIKKEYEQGESRELEFSFLIFLSWTLFIVSLFSDWATIAILSLTLTFTFTTYWCKYSNKQFELMKTIFRRVK